MPEGTEVTFQCSTPYVCPLSDVALRWAGYDERVSSVSPRLQLDTSGVGHHLSLATSFSWKDHAKELFCEVLHGSQKASGELVLRVRRTWGRVSPASPSLLLHDQVPQPPCSAPPGPFCPLCPIFVPFPLLLSSVQSLSGLLSLAPPLRQHPRGPSRLPLRHRAVLCPPPQTPPKAPGCRSPPRRRTSWWGTRCL